MWYNGGMADWLKEWALVISAGVTLLLAIAAFWAIWQNYQIYKRKRESDLLYKIVDWALEIQNNSLEVNIPLSTELSVEQMRINAEANSLFKYGITFTKNTHVMAIANKVFRKDLKREVEETINIFTAFLFLKGLSFGMKNVQEAFGGTATLIMNELEGQSKDDPTKLAQLLEDYSKKIATSANKLLIKAGEIAARLT